MPRGGARPGAGRKPSGAPKKSKKTSADLPGSYAPNGRKTPEAPANWPFGTQDPAATPGAPADDADPVIPGGAPLEFLQSVIDATHLKLAVRMQAAAIAVGFVHAKLAPMGKKETKAEAAKKVGTGKYTQSAPPKLVVNNGK